MAVIEASKQFINLYTVQCTEAVTGVYTVQCTEAVTGSGHCTVHRSCNRCVHCKKTRCTRVSGSKSRPWHNRTIKLGQSLTNSYNIIILEGSDVYVVFIIIKIHHSTQS